MSNPYRHPISTPVKELQHITSIATDRLIDRVSDEILRAMTANNISQRDLAALLHVSEARVSQMLNRSNMRLSTADRVFAALGMIPTFSAARP